MSLIPYYGDHLTVGDCELLALSRVTAQLRHREADLYMRKWFDYRGLHPVKATYLFAQAYQNALKAAYIETRDKHTADTVRAFKGDIFMGADLTNCWRARQMLDAYGVRYDFAMRFAMKRFTERGWRMFPRPNQLYGEEFLLDLRDAWVIECDASLQIAGDDRFRLEQYAGHPDQDAYRAWLVTQIKRRALPHLALVRTLNERLFDVEYARKCFTSETFKKALARLPDKVSKS